MKDEVITMAETVGRTPSEDPPRTVSSRGARSSSPSHSMSSERSRAIAALILLLFSGFAAALFNPFGVPVEIELAMPVVLAVWLGGCLTVRWYLA
jgi:hypothetical protein